MRDPIQMGVTSGLRRRGSCNWGLGRRCVTLRGGGEYLFLWSEGTVDGRVFSSTEPADMRVGAVGLCTISLSVETPACVVKEILLAIWLAEWTARGLKGTRRWRGYRPTTLGAGQQPELHVYLIPRVGESLAQRPKLGVIKIKSQTWAPLSQTSDCIAIFHKRWGLVRGFCTIYCYEAQEGRGPRVDVRDFPSFMGRYET